uniref:Immunoglobulin V-set domain-containing protein n=1 Tax=Scophthalmus maximus TaxID=52904 RepID=A0A8D3CAC1_SCOMX
TCTQGFEGGRVSFRCSHKLAKQDNKYLCRDPCTRTEDILVTVKSGGRAESERITLDHEEQGVYTVTMSMLTRDDAGRYRCALCILIMQPKLLLFQKCKRMTTSVSTGNASCSLSLLLPSFASLTLWLLTYPPPTADRTKIRGPPTQPTAASPSPTSPPATLHVGHSNSGDLITDKQLLFRPAFIHNSPENVT